MAGGIADGELSGVEGKGEPGTLIHYREPAGSVLLKTWPF